MKHFFRWVVLWVGILSLSSIQGADQSRLPRALPKVRLERILPELTLERPIWMEEVSGRLYLVEQQGRIITTQKGGDGKQTAEFLNIVDRKPLVDNEEGLLGLAFHPGFATNRLFYIYYTGHNPRRSIISEFKTSNDGDKADLTSERVVMEIPQPYSNHNGGQISFGPDGFLYITLGDGGAGDDPHNNGQNSASFLGKILRIEVNTRATINKKQVGYGIPKDNPFVKWGSGVRHEVWAYGLRNVWRFSWDRQTGEMWAGDVGQNLWEEVDIIVKGGNYGWSAREGFHDFKPHAEGATYREPIIEYPHNPQIAPQSPFPHDGFGLSITGGYVYRGKKSPTLQGLYIYGDYALGSVFGLRHENGRVSDQMILLQQPKNIMSFAQDLDGELYLLAQDGGVYNIVSEPSKELFNRGVPGEWVRWPHGGLGTNDSQKRASPRPFGCRALEIHPAESGQRNPS
jgi:glucose/arabinose dehydrogenase